MLTYSIGICHDIFTKGKIFEKTPHNTNQNYSVVWGHHWSRYTERQSSLMNVLVRDMDNLRITLVEKRPLIPVCNAH
jgi:hypothetical protein